MTMRIIRAQIEASIAVKKAVLDNVKLVAQIETLAMMCETSLKSGGKIIFAGNGGSFADAQHLSAEFISRFMFDRAPLASLVLGANNSAISAIGNDYGFEQVFARELGGVAKAGDVFIPISTSGNSPNILSAVEQAAQLGLATTALTGLGGGKLAKLCNCLCIPSGETARIQECHIMIGHIVCGIVEKRYFEGAC
ncbi:MAG: SIS domain-containing protein [Gammaproteobacteria bacterium]|nr:SIS domain-containing protein [Gammaproteobacteria bacterium]MBU0788297.1 SIS domain-containing protein [Gammaproteobacteria bacterium]MBU0815206.1 SIS domain-containing protein [Gammaproteobacteria bacterium]MBU1785686.1 SIS domain-containing protein [Gammaproteobacteria bacterium]